MTAESIAIDVVPDQQCVVVAVAGEVDLLTADEMRDAIMTEVGRHPVVVVDLTAVQFLSSSGLTALAEASRAASAGGIDLRIVAADRLTLRPLQITGMASQLAIFGSRAEAIEGRRPTHVPSATS